MLFNVGELFVSKIRSRINQQLIAGHFGHKGLRQLRAKLFCTQLTKASMAKTSCN